METTYMVKIILLVFHLVNPITHAEFDVELQFRNGVFNDCIAVAHILENEGAQVSCYERHYFVPETEYKIIKEHQERLIP